MTQFKWHCKVLYERQSQTHAPLRQVYHFVTYLCRWRTGHAPPCHVYVTKVYKRLKNLKRLSLDYITCCLKQYFVMFIYLRQGLPVQQLIEKKTRGIRTVFAHNKIHCEENQYYVNKVLYSQDIMELLRTEILVIWEVLKV